MNTIVKYIGHRARFILDGIKFEGTFAGIGNKKGTDDYGILFEDVRESFLPMSSCLLVHPDRIRATNRLSHHMIRRSRAIFKSHSLSSNLQVIYFPRHQIKTLRPDNIPLMV